MESLAPRWQRQGRRPLKDLFSGWSDNVTVWQSVSAVYLGCLTHGACVSHWTPDYNAIIEATGSACKGRWLECCHLCWTSLCAACLYIIARPDSQFLCTRVYFWFSVASGSVTFWWQSYACNCSMVCMCIRSGSPHNVVHFLVIQVVWMCDWLTPYHKSVSTFVLPNKLHHFHYCMV